ncbi:hypothetical protein JXR01_00420 [Candidatus Kaiserbacteria bacterium]|nr:MAG: hypothetical protein JXR01_00420 [Candidatus Kaiserbacteria bacterium]
MSIVRRIFGLALWIICLGVFMTPKGLFGLDQNGLVIFLVASAIGWMTVVIYFVQGVHRRRFPRRIFLSSIVAAVAILVEYLLGDAYAQSFEAYESIIMTIFLFAPIAAGARLVLFESGE